MRTFETFMAVGIVALAIGCGGSSGSGSGADGGGTVGGNGRTVNSGGQCPSNTGQTCAGEAAYETCLTNACGSQMKTCLGNNYASGSYSGPCADYMNCQLKCPCDSTATTCELNCYTQYLSSTTSTCWTCLSTVNSCVQGSGCVDPCDTSTSTTTATGTNTSTSTKTTTSTTTSTTTATGASCAALQTCCTTLAALAGMTVQECQTAYGVVPETTCATVLTSYQSAGYCK